MRSTLLPLVAALLAPAGLCQQLLVVESTNDLVMMLDGTDGSLINASFIDLTLSTGASPSTPIEVAEVAGELWVTDQLADVIFRWSADGTTYLGDTGAGRDNMRGLCLANGSVWVTNAGSSGAGYGEAIKEYDTAGTFLAANPAVGSPFDVIDNAGDLLVADIDNDTVERYGYDGASLGTFSGASSLNFPEQIARTSSGNLLVAGFSTPSGIFEFDGTTGVELSFIDTAALGYTGLRGVHELGNGNILFTNGSGVHVYDAGLGTVSTVVGGVSGRFITELGGGGGGITGFLCDPANAHSGGVPATLASSSVSGPGVLHLEATDGPPSEFGYFLVSLSAAEPGTPISNGNLCLLAPIGRYAPAAGGALNSIGQFDGAGVLQNMAGTSSVGSGYDVMATLPTPPGGTITAGTTYYFQCWFRDGNRSNFSNVLEFTP
jgi:hypothetical protein